MKSIMGFKCFIGIFFLVNTWYRASACDGKPVVHFNTGHLVVSHVQTDTLPPKVKAVEKAEVKPVEEVIKVVPKVRKQVVPVPVTLPMKPQVIIKPKIIKPVIKILH